VLELVDRVLQLLIEHDAVGHNDHTVEHTLIRSVMQRRQPMGQPAYGVALAAARRVFDEIVVAHALTPCGIDQGAHRLKLVVAREDQRLLLHLAALIVALLLDLQVNEARQQIEQAVPLQHLLPEIGGAVGASSGVERIASAAVASLVEGQEVGGRAREARSHQHGFGIDGEVHQRAALKFEDRLARIAIVLVLPSRVLDRLSCERILELHGGDGDAIQAERDIERLLRARREVQLPRDAEPVGGVARLQFRIQFVRRLEVSHVQRPPVTLEAMAQRRQ
jgi:hypothetical protein